MAKLFPVQASPRQRSPEARTPAEVLGAEEDGRPQGVAAAADPDQNQSQSQSQTDTEVRAQADGPSVADNPTLPVKTEGAEPSPSTLPYHSRPPPL